MQPDHPIVQQMRKAASVASENAYCPYSNFRVGAAVLTDDGEIFAGCNVENASLGLTICAERNAVFQAVAKGHHKIRAVTIFTQAVRPTPPCGACRQVINEFGPDAEIFTFTDEGKAVRVSLKELLPDAFGPRSIA